MPKTGGHTEHIGRKAAENICHAFDYAKYVGKPLNFYVVINLNEEASRTCATTIFKAIRHKFRDWLNYALKKASGAASAPAQVYSLERPNGHPHANWALHVPDMLQEEFHRKLPDWVRKAQGIVRLYDITVEAVGPETDKSLGRVLI